MYGVSTSFPGRKPKARNAASDRINLRVDPAIKALLARAAKLQRLGLTEFMVSSSQAAAEAVLAERTRFVLPADKWREFNAALDKPASAIPALKKLLSEPSIFEPK